MKQVWQNMVATLSPVYGDAEARELAYWILEETMGLTRADVQFGCKVTENFPNFQIILERLLKKEPIQQIFGHTIWNGLDLEVTSDTLIPRPETAELVELIGTKEPGTSLHVLDIGTGTGCIAIALQKAHPSWQVDACDVSHEALEVAQRNARKNDVNVRFFALDVLADCWNDDYDIIVSNPPYICDEEKADMDENVLQYEPATALFVPDNDPLLFYRRIACLAAEKARANGRSVALYFEINERFGKATAEMMQTAGYKQIEVEQDIYGKDRMVCGKIE